MLYILDIYNHMYTMETYIEDLQTQSKNNCKKLH